MKIFSKILLFISAGAALISCENFLDVQNYVKDMTQYDSIFVKRTTTEDWLWNVYSRLYDLPSLNNGALYYASDEVIYNDADLTCQKYQNCQYSASDQLWEDRYTSMYVGIRTASILIHNVHKCVEVSSSLRDRMEGEARFLRAYYYFTLMRQYGPVPIVPDEGQDISLDYDALALPRASVDELVEFMCADLERAARVLPSEQAAAWIGRATQGAALALRAKILLYAASPLFNGNQDMFNMKDTEGKNLIPQEYSVEKWARAAAAAKEVMMLGAYQLLTVKKSATTVPLASNVPTEKFPSGAGDIDPFQSYAQLFNGDTPLTVNYEVIFARQNGSADVNSFVYKAFPFTQKGINNMGATMKQVNAYYMRDGRDILSSSQEFPYITDGFTDIETKDPFVPTDCHKMWLNREPRFYASIAYNGCIWENGTGLQQNRNFKADYYRGGADGKSLGKPNNYPLTGIGIKKYYNPDDSWNEGGRTTHKPTIDIRYADVLLWYAETLNELPDGEQYTYNSTLTDEPITVSRDIEAMKDAFSTVRYRAGLPDLSESEYKDPDVFREKLKRERQIEFFMEGARYFDLRRWKDAEVQENEAVIGMNVDMKGSGVQKERFYDETPVPFEKVFMSKMYFWPFTAAELQKNGKLTQNPGW